MVYVLQSRRDAMFIEKDLPPLEFRRNAMFIEKRMANTYRSYNTVGALCKRAGLLCEIIQYIC